jgi:uncharacterized protein YcfJ
MIHTNERINQMKLKALVVAMAFITGAAQAGVRYTQEVQVDPVPQVYSSSVQTVSIPVQHQRLYPVVSVVPVEHTQSFPETNHVCRYETVPMYRNVPVTSTSYQNNPNTGLGTLVGAVIGGAIVPKGDVLAGVLVGGALGHAATSQPVVTTTVHGHTTEFVGYRDVKKCEVVHGSYQKRVIIGYNVTYSDNGVLNTITTTRHPGSHIRLQ